MDQTKDIDLDKLVRTLYVFHPNLPQNEEFSSKLRAKLEEQIKEKVPKVQLEQLDLKYIILNVKKSLSYLQKRIDCSFSQQLRRTKRVRKSIDYNEDFTGPKKNKKNQLESKSIKSSSPDISKPLSFPPPSSSKKDTLQSHCSTIKCCHHLKSESDLVGWVQVESLPVTASTNLVTIFVPSILQEKLHSVKYKISIDLNRLDLTKEILDLNISQRECDLKADRSQTNDNSEERKNSECEVSCQVKCFQGEHVVEDETQTAVNAILRDEHKATVDESDNQCLRPAGVSIVEVKDDIVPTSIEKVHGSKRKNTSKDPPKKRGRKPGSKNKPKIEKSELAKYVEMFECNGNSPSSAISQIVTSTTQNWEVVPEQSAEISYFMNGEWTPLAAPLNDAAPGLVTTTCLDEFTENGNIIPFDDFVNFFESPSIDQNNVIARVLEGAVDTQEVVLQSPQDSGISLLVDQSKSDAKAQTNQFDMSTVRLSTSATQPITDDNTIKENDNVIFSVGRSMSILDTEEGDLFCSTPQRVNSSQNIIFCMNPKQKKIYSNSDSKMEIGKKCVSSDNNIETEKTQKNAIISANNKAKGETLKEMSLLEVEKDFDDSLLDFDDCLDDDLLSLAPSSGFNSPNDDRFAEPSFVKTNETALNSYTDVKISTNPFAPKSHLEKSSVTQSGDDIKTVLKSFKIPKAKTVKNLLTDSSLESNCTVKPPQISVKKCGGAVGDLKFLSEANADIQCVSLNQTFIKETTPTHDISKIFGSLCYKFLADMCFESSCDYSHELLDPIIMSISIKVLQNEALNMAYRFIWRNNKLFKLYFPIFCEEYGHRNMREKLMTMVRDCEIQPNCISFMKHIHTSLTKCGLSKTNACRYLLRKIQSTSYSTINVLMEIIIESDAQMFTSAIEQFSTVNGYKFSMESINELAKICLRSGNDELVPALIKCLINVDQKEFLTLRSPELIQLLEMVKCSGEV